MAALIWRERLALKNERELLLKEVAAQKESLMANGVKLNKGQEDVRRILQAINGRAARFDPTILADLQNAINRAKPTLSDSELDRIKRESAALGAPQPVPLPPAFSEKPD